MSARPAPPILPQNASSFEKHAREHLPDWFNYCRQAYAYMDSQDIQINKLNQQITAQDQKIATQDPIIAAQDQEIAAREQTITALEAKVLEGVIIERTLLAQLKDKDAQIIEATVTARLARQAGLPTVRALTPDASRFLAEEAPAPHLGTPAPPAAESAASSRLSEKLPDPDKFDGTRSDLRRFLQQIHAKMSSNADRFPSAASRLTYVAGRLTGKAYNLILPRTVLGVPQFADYPELLAYLENAFGDPDRIQNAQNLLYRLKQRNQDFSTYFSEFQRLALEGEMPEDALTPLLFQGISRELQDMLLHSPAPAREFHQYANHLQTLDNRYRQHQQQMSRIRPADQTPAPRLKRSPSPRRGRSPPSLAITPGDRMDLSNQRRAPGPNRKVDNLCYRCGSNRHYVRDCPKPDTRNIQAQSAALHHSGSSTPSSSTSSSRRLTPSPDQMENGESLS
jgi:Domain of unknown function (DUF4939)